MRVITKSEEKERLVLRDEWDQWEERSKTETVLENLVTRLNRKKRVWISALRELETMCHELHQERMDFLKMPSIQHVQQVAQAEIAANAAIGNLLAVDQIYSLCVGIAQLEADYECARQEEYAARFGPEVFSSHR